MRNVQLTVLTIFSILLVSHIFVQAEDVAASACQCTECLCYILFPLRDHVGDAIEALKEEDGVDNFYSKAEGTGYIPPVDTTEDVVAHTFEIHELGADVIENKEVSYKVRNVQKISNLPAEIMLEE